MPTTSHALLLNACRRWCVRCAVIVIFCEPFAGLSALGQAGKSENSPKSLARCNVQSLKAAAASTMSGENAIFFIDTTPTDDPMLDYHPLRETPPQGDAASVDAGRLRVLVTGPGPARVIDFTVMIDGEPFRAQRDRWIDELIEQSPAEQQIRNAGEAVSDAITALASAVDVPALNPDSTKPRTRTAQTLRSRIVNFLAAVGSDVDRQEVVSLMNQWPSGPAITVLSPGRSWQRAGRTPLLTLLDRDGDGALSTNEIAGASDSLASADIDQNGIVESREMRRRGRRATRRHASSRLLTVVDSAGDWRKRLGRNADQLDVERIATGEPDMRAIIHFGKSSGMELITLNGVQADAIQTGDDVLSIDFGAEHYELAAVQTGAESDPYNAPDQIAVGAAVDGRPLLRLIDADNDGRLTAREQRRLPALLTSLDANRDGSLGEDEIPFPLRIVVGRGAIVHRVLEEPTISVRKIGEVEVEIAAPEWFKPMDANGDGELSRGEFPGDAEQFKALDTDGDGLISAAEAAAMEA